MNKTAFIALSLTVACSFIAVNCVPIGRHPTAKPSPVLPSLAPPWPAPTSPGPSSEVLDRDKNPSDEVQTKQETSQEEENKSCQKKKNSSAYFFQPVLKACLSCIVFCVDNKDWFCEVCNNPTTTVPSLVDTSTTPTEDAPSSFGDNTETEFMTTDDVPTTDVSSSSNAILTWLLVLLATLVILVGISGLRVLYPCVTKKIKGRAGGLPAGRAQTTPTTPATPEEEETCLDGISVDNIESSLTKPHQDTGPVPSSHPMGGNSFSSSFSSTTNGDS